MLTIKMTIMQMDILFTGLCYTGKPANPVAYGQQFSDLTKQVVALERSFCT